MFLSVFFVSTIRYDSSLSIERKIIRNREANEGRERVTQKDEFVSADATDIDQLLLPYLRFERLFRFRDGVEVAAVAA